MTGSPDSPVDEESCHRILRALDIIGVRWTGPILLAGARGARRFKEYRALVPGISDPQLSLRLKQLQSRGLMERTVVPSTPVQIMYALTPDAEELISALQPLSRWSERNSLREARRDAEQPPASPGSTGSLRG
ncbi:helix-turn-helix domain-containing protein [Streptomyces sp. WMMC500]|uniref:winged helix-turn-helix transcriptional regulator n=1 Tax=Streptomyces sp. WMMC500 TaxID=3015154 RepID=UPI00248C6765|nr:helix-turn-helix domain-containing protein [Streptomyces sp. WMMC500]WBB60216.1 helix-turn-helix domain-containing protein [Streptomyces sp. WMMC500]